jgi:hypothetical protein
MTPLEISVCILLVVCFVTSLAKHYSFFTASFIGSVVTSVNTFFIETPENQSLAVFWLIYCITTAAIYVLLKVGFSGVGGCDHIDIDFD